VEEVFRVVTRKLVEQNRKAMEMGFSPGGTPSAAPGMDGAAGYFDGMAARGSFRVGRDRRSWLGFPSAVLIDEAAEQETAPDERKVRRKCC
jgi:hypothetical protein